MGKNQEHARGPGISAIAQSIPRDRIKVLSHPAACNQLTVSTAQFAGELDFTNGVQASYVEVDVETGMVKLLKHWVVEDCGRIINPLLVDEQIRGGVVQGLGAAFFEECLYDDAGQLTNGSPADYLVPMAGEMPDIEIAHVETPTLDTILGAKGVGEAGTAAAGAATMNAVNDALRPFAASISQTPMTPVRILRALGHV